MTGVEGLFIGLVLVDLIIIAVGTAILRRRRFLSPVRRMPSPRKIAMLYSTLTIDTHKETVWRMLENLLDLEAALRQPPESEKS